MKKKYALLGRNIKYSLSPKIYNYWFEKYNIDSIYELKDIEKLTSDCFLNNCYQGFNYTTPFKSVILSLSLPINVSSEVSIIRAVNVSKQNDNSINVYNTDYLGLLDSYKYFNLNINKKNILVLGGSGAARATIYSAILSHAHNVYIWCRDFEIRRNLINDFSILFPVQEYNLQEVDIIFNATTAPFDELISQLNLIIDNKITYDLNYYQKNKAKITFNGLMMLIYQAVHNFNIWFNIKPAVDRELLKIIGA